MPPNVFCLVIVLFCARQIDKTPATVTNFQFSIFIAGFTFPTTCPAGSLCIRLRFLCATCAAAETVSNLKKKPFDIRLTNLSRRRRRRRVCTRTAKISF